MNGFTESPAVGISPSLDYYNCTMCSELCPSLGYYDYTMCREFLCPTICFNINDYMEAADQNMLDAPMPWIGMYIAAASAVCSLAMAVDALTGFKSKRMWFPCKYFSLNATSLTLLGVTMKLTLDLTNTMMGIQDKIAKLSSLVMMSTAIGNFMISMASMDNNEILLSLTALGILVITIAVNVCIHSAQTLYVRGGHVVLAEETAAIIFMLLLLIVLCSYAIVVPTTKRYIESKYRAMLKILVSNERLPPGGKLTLLELKVVLKKYYVMAETGNPQFVMARSVICVISGVMCLLVALTLIEAYMRMSLDHRDHSRISSNYKWSINWILFIQYGGVALGTIAPVFRWFTAVRFWSSKIDHRRSFKEELKIETYWTQRLVEWRESSLPLRIRHQKFRKVVHDAKRLLLNVCIGIQRLIILSSKLVLIISAALIYVPVLMFNHIKKWPSNDTRGGLTSRAADAELDFRPYILLLEGEPEIPKKVLTNICIGVDNLIKIGNTQKPKNIVELLNKSENFNGVKEFDNNEVRSLHSQKPPNCWSLSLVTLSSIAVALPNISNHIVDQLLKSVSEGLSFVKLIEKIMDTNGELVNMRSAADVVWVGLELYHKWQDEDIRGTNLNDRTYKQTLQDLSDIAEKKVVDFKTNTNDLLMENPVNWPVNIIAANSMYRICQTLLLALRNDCNRQTDEEMFERLTVIISDILAACLTNLSHTITIKCQSIAIKDRVESVRHAAVLLGESEEILQLLEQRELPNLDPGKAAYIDEWRAFMDQDVESPMISGSASSNETTVREPNGQHVLSIEQVALQ